MKKIFILTGEPSGDKLASKVIKEFKKENSKIEYLSVGGENLEALGIKSIYDLKEITYIGFTNVIKNIFKINKKINETVKAIKDFNPDILFTVDSPDFTLRVAERVKKQEPKIKTIHYVAPQVWVWREGRVKKIKKFIDHILLLFNFEKPYFDKENMSNEFVGHPLLDDSSEGKIDINQIFEKNKALISIFPGSAKSGTVSLEICKSKVPSIILYKMNFLNYLIVRSLIKVKFANIINIAAGKEVIPELLQSKCNPKDLFKSVSAFIDDLNKIKEQVEKTQSILNRFNSDISSSILASRALSKYL